MPNFSTHTPKRVIPLGALTIAIGFLALKSVAADPERRNQTFSVPVQNGRAVFGMRARGPGDSFMLVVSSLSRRPGPFEVRIDARETGDIVSVSPDKSILGSNVNPPRNSPRPILAAETEPLGAPLRERFFHLPTREGDPRVVSNYVRVRGVLRAYDRRAEIYVDENDLERVSSRTLFDLLETFSKKIEPQARQMIGQARDVDGDGRFLIFLTGRLAHLSGDRFAVDGFVRTADFRLDLPTPYGNRADMVYLNAGLNRGAYLRTILAHEYAHAVLTTARISGARFSETDEEESWLDEAIAHLFERWNDFSALNLDYRIDEFLNGPERYRLVVKDYLSADLFRSHGCRGGSYLFLQFLADRYGRDMLRRLIESDLRGTECVEAAVGKSFSNLFREWTVDLALNGLEPSADSASAIGIRSINLRDRFGERPLAGPKFDRSKVGEGPTSIMLVGTSAKYLEIPFEACSAVEIEVQGSADAELQVTAIRLAEPLPLWSLTVDRAAGSTADPEFFAKLRQTGGGPVRLERLSWQPLVSGDEGRFPRPTVHELSGPCLLDLIRIEGKPTDCSSAKPLRMTSADLSNGPLLFKVLGRDDRGRRIVAETVVRQGKSRSDLKKIRGLKRRRNDLNSGNN